MKTCLSVIFLILVGMLLIPLASATITVNGSSIEKSYRGGDTIKGSVTISFRDIPLRSKITSNVLGEISLKEWLDAHNLVPGTSYNCSTEGCGDQSARGQPVQNILVSNTSKIGFSFEGQSIVGIDSLSFTVQGTTAASCFPQLEVQFADDPLLKLSSKVYLDELCFQPTYGCFEPGRPTTNAEIPADGQYCEKITLPAGPAYRIGARIMNTTASTSVLTMKLYGLDSSLLGECVLPQLANSSDVVSCVVPRGSAKEQAYFVCVRAQTASSYSIRTEGNQPCGTINFGETYPRDYEIFAQNLKFGNPVIVVNDETFLSATGAGLRDTLEQFLQSTYQNRCEPYCIAPFTIKGASQTAVISNPRSVYDIDGALNVPSDQVYSLLPGNTTIQSGFLNLDISKLGFMVSLGSTPKNFVLTIDEKRILNESISVSPSFDFILGPSIARVGQQTLFGLSIGRNVSSVSWSFGDGSVSQTTNVPQITYRYTQTGTFNLTAEVQDSTGAISRKTIRVQVGDAQVAANLTIQEYRRRISSLDQGLSTYPQWVKDRVTTALDVEAVSATVESIARAYDVAENESDYVVIINRLLALAIPQEINVNSEGSLPLALGFESIDTRIVEELTGRAVENRGSFISNLAYWNLQRFDAEISYKTVLGSYDRESEPLFTLISIDPRAKAEVEESYLVLSYDPAALKSKDAYEERSLAGAAAYKIVPGTVYEFLILDSVDAIDLGSFITPLEVDPLLVEDYGPVCFVDNKCDEAAGENADNCPDCASHISFYVWVILILLILLGIAVGAVWWWYKTRYEASIFPNKGDLQNIILFIRSQRKNNVSEKDIKEKLKKAGWDSEQIAYGLKKSVQNNPPVDRKQVKN